MIASLSKKDDKNIGDYKRRSINPCGNPRPGKNHKMEVVAYWPIRPEDPIKKNEGPILDKSP